MNKQKENKKKLRQELSAKLDMTFQQAMKKALSTPLPKNEIIIKKKIK